VVEHVGREHRKNAHVIETPNGNLTGEVTKIGQGQVAVDDYLSGTRYVFKEVDVHVKENVTLNLEL